MPLSVQLDGGTFQQPRPRHVVCGFRKKKKPELLQRVYVSFGFVIDTNSNSVDERHGRMLQTLTRRHVEHAFAQDWDLADSTFGLEIAIGHHFRHVKVDFQF